MAAAQRGGGGRRAMDENANHVFETSKGVEPILSFEAMGIKEDLLRGIYNYGFEKPSAIQQRAVFPIIFGRDVIAQAHSGTGKTSMIALAVSQIVDTKSPEVQALILSPTRELATQTERLILAIGGYINVQAHACVGGESLGEDIGKLEDGVHVVSGTPGLVCDMIKRRTLRTRAIKLLILDESDEMLSKGFKDQIYDVYRYLPPELQVVLISATLSNEILEITSKFMTDPVRILVKRDELTLELPPPPRARPKRFVKNQIPDSILNDAALNATIAILPANYNFEIHKIIWRVRSANATRVALQFPEGLLMYSLVISDILTAFAGVTHCFVLGDVTYGACCVDDLSSRALDAHLLVHFGHSCLVPIDTTTVPVLYIFVEIAINTRKLLQELNHNFNPDEISNFIMAGTIQFSNAIRTVKPELENLGFRVLVPQSKPLSAGEVLGCTAPSVKLQVCSGKEDVIIFVADGRFHLEAFMIANPLVKAFRYDPYIGKLFLEEYDHEGMKKDRKKAIEKAMGAKIWGIVLGTLGRQGNPIMVERLERKIQDKGLDYMVVLISELSPNKIELFGDAVDAWVQVACPRLSIDWGDAFKKPLLTSFEAEIALGDRPGWWERKLRVNGSSQCMMKEDCCANGSEEASLDYPMDYYAQDGGEWNSSYSKKGSRYRGKTKQCCSNNGC